MKGLDLVESEQWLLSPYIGYEHPFFTVNIKTVTHTWAMLGIMILLLIPVRLALKKKDGMVRFLALSFVQFFVDMANQALTTFSFAHFSFIATIFCFILASNMLSVIPWWQGPTFMMKEPTTDLNTTFALGIISFLYIQGAAIKAQGLWLYIKGYFSPFFIMLPLNVVGKFAMIISISFRLFGNIFGGSIITEIWFQLIRGSFVFETIGMLSGINMLIVLFFGIFEGFLQAFVFAMLTLTYLSIALTGEEH